MRNTTLIILTLLINQIFAQKGFTPKMESFIDDYLTVIDSARPELQTAKNWFEDFKKAKKPDIKVYQSKLIGLAVEMSKEDNKTINYLPISYTLKDSKISFKKITPKKYKQELIDSYNKSYFKNKNALKKEILFKELINDKFIFSPSSISENESELYLKGGFYLYFLRQYKNFLYIVTLNRNFIAWKNKPIGIYRFDLSLEIPTIIKDSLATNAAIRVKKNTPISNYKIPNRWEGINRLYHDVAIEELRKTVKLLAQITPYSNDQDFVLNAKKLNKPLNRDNIQFYIPQLHFFSDYEIKLSDDMISKLGYYDKESIKNINHYASHAVADIFMTNKEYKKAITAFGNAIKSKYHTAGGTRYIKCLGRIYSDLAEAAFASNQHSTGVLYLLALIAQRNNYSDYADKQLIEYAKTVNSKKFKEDLILAIYSVKLKGKSDYTITFQNQVGTFERPFSTARSIQIPLVKSDTYSQFCEK